MTRRLVELAVEDDSEDGLDWIGRWVRVIKRDEYYGRVGTVTGL